MTDRQPFPRSDSEAEPHGTDRHPDGAVNQAPNQQHDHGSDAHHAHDDHVHGHETGLRARVFHAFRSLFGRHSHDHADSIDSALESSTLGIRAVKISLVGLLATSLFQVVIVAITGSVALLADTIHNFSDALTAIPLWIAFVLGRRMATRSYTFGYRRAEDLSGLFIVAMIAFSAIFAGWESVQRLSSPNEVSNLPLLIAAGVFGFAGNELVAIYRIRVGRRIGSAALVADGLHARTDGLTSLAVVLGAIGVALGFPAADPVVGLFITVAILFVLRDAAKQVFRRLMDAVEPETVELIERSALGVDGVNRVEGVRVRWVGHRLDASLHVVVDARISVADGHAVAEAVRHDLFHALPSLDEATIHVDPDGPDDHHGATRHHLARRVDPAHGGVGE